MLTRRDLLQKTATGFGMLGLASLMADQNDPDAGLQGRCSSRPLRLPLEKRVDLENGSCLPRMSVASAC